YLAIPYGQVALAAALPAVLYYLALFVQIDLEAAKLGLTGLPRAELPRLREVMRVGWVFLVPLGVLLYTLMISNWEAGTAGMLAVLIGPSLTQLGIDPLAAHLFLFYFGMLSLITPPDCLATYAAAAIAKADFWKTGWVGMRLGIVAYVVPFIFAFHPALIGH